MNTPTKILLGVITLGAAYLFINNNDNPTEPTPSDDPSKPVPVKVPAPTPTTVVEPAQQPATGNAVYWNKKADSSLINLYKSISDYPGKPYLQLPIGAKNRKPMRYLGFQGYKYPNSNVVTTLYLIQLPNVAYTTFVPAQYLSVNPNQ